MVRLINNKNIGLVSDVLYKILRIQEIFTHIVEIDNPNLTPCIYAMWHENQFMVHGFPNKSKTSILVSNSFDGEIVARICEKWGFKVVRGSSGRKGAVESTMHMLNNLQNGECVGIMVDGPRGPLHKVKDGALKLAQKTGAPIVPSFWYSPQSTFRSLPSWDKIRLPIGDCKILNIYGKPIYVKQDATDEELNEIREVLRQSILDLEAKAPKLYEEACKNKLWAKK